MKRQINKRIILVVVFSFMLFLLGSTFIVRNYYNKITEFHLNHYINQIEYDYEEGESYQDIRTKYTSGDSTLRITFVDAGGVVLFDTHAEDLDNHADRPEIQNPGTAEIRWSDTLNQRMMYLAHELDDGIILRIALPISSILPFLNDAIGLTIVLSVAIIVFVSLLSMVLTRRLINPLTDIQTNLKEVYEGNYKEIMPVKDHPELNGIINEINSLNKKISDTITSLNKEKRKTSFLLDHMNQGLAVLDHEKSIMLVNAKLAELFSFSRTNIGNHYSFLIRDSRIRRAVEAVYQNQSTKTVVADIDDRFFSVVVSYLESDWSDDDVVLLSFSDITMMKRIEKVKRDFFVNASHELKSPLTSIMGAAELIDRKMVKDKQSVEDLARRILQESNRMNRLVMDMLNLSKYEEHDLPESETDVSVKTVANDVLDTLMPLAEKQAISLHFQAEAVTYHAKKEDLRQLIKNLVENAIQYNEQGGHVWVSLSGEDDHVTIEVADDGIGIPKNDRNRIFERFYRVDKARSKKTGGTGLGLSIVKHIVLSYHGKIDLSSEEGQGTSIIVSLPKKKHM